MASINLSLSGNVCLFICFLLTNFNQILLDRILYYFHDNKSKRRFNAKVHPPRLNGKSCGVFASRAPHRPNPIGLTLAKIESVNGGCLYVSGIDIIDGTPVIDIKPYIAKYDQPNVSEESLSKTTIPSDDKPIEPSAQASSSTVPEGWVDGSIVSTVTVEFTSRSLSQLALFHPTSSNHDTCQYCFRLFKNNNEAREAIDNLLHADPRSVYRRNKCVDRLYYFTIDSIHITAWFDIETNLVEVLKIKPLETNNSVQFKLL